MEKVYKAGTIVKLWCCTHDLQSEESEEYTLECDMTESELTDMAEELMWNRKEPEWAFDVLKEVK